MRPETRSPHGLARWVPQSSLARIILLAALYVLTGKLGQLVAIPPGYATIIWLPAGLSVGFLLFGGWRLWPGVLLGAFILNAFPGVWTPEHGVSAQKIGLALAIASGSTLQALLACMIIVRSGSPPLKFSRASELVRVFVLAGPCACIVAPSIGITALAYAEALSREQIVDSWLIWWGGDFFGVIVFVPLVLAAVGHQYRLIWRDKPIGGGPLLVMLALLIPLGITLHAWKVTGQRQTANTANAFEDLVLESEQALANRMSSYQQALRGAAAYVLTSGDVTQNDWRHYVRSADIEEAFPGITALGIVELRNNRSSYVVTRLEPERKPRSALGVDLAAEPLRREAVELARDSGKPTMTKKLLLAGRTESTPGFLLLYPLYTPGLPASSVEERGKAIRGWIVASVMARSFLDGLTRSQGTLLNLAIFDADRETARNLIYSSAVQGEPAGAFKVRKQLKIMNRTWLAVWTSTPSFDVSNQSNEASKVLIGGLVLSGLLAMLVLVSTARSLESIQWLATEKGYLPPLAVLLIVSAGSFYLYHVLAKNQQRMIQKVVTERAERARALMDAELASRITSLKRMAQRWDAAHGTPEDQWRKDASSYVHYRPGLKSLHWIDAAHRLRWDEPAGSGVFAELTPDSEAPGKTLAEAASGQVVVISPLFDIDAVSRGFIVYVPVARHGRPDGFIAGLFNAREFFSGIVASDLLRSDLLRDFSVIIRADDAVAWESRPAGAPIDGRFSYVGYLNRGGKRWTVSVTPLATFTKASATRLPAIGLGTGLLLAVLLASVLRAMIVARLRTAYLAKSNELNSAIMSSAESLIVAVDREGLITSMNRAAELALGYTESEVAGKQTPLIWHDEAEIARHAAELTRELGIRVDAGFDSFIAKARLKGVDDDEWTLVRKDGSRFPGHLTVTPLRTERGDVTGYLGVVEDITEQKEMDRLKSEFISVVSHELRTPLTAIRGSLGLTLGALGDQLSDQVKDLLTIANTNCERLMLLINDILDIDKIASGRMRCDLRAHSLAAITRRAVEAMQPYAQKFDVYIDLAPIDANICVNVDEDRFIQVLSNLLSNAAKFSPQHATVQVFARVAPGWVRLCVKDSGSGVPDAFRNRIFEKFTQADTSATRRAGGTGLGLYIARQWVERMSGRIGFESAAGEGSTFWIELPWTSAHGTAAISSSVAATSSA